MLELQQRVADRDLSPVKLRLFELLSAPPHGNIQMQVLSNDAEAARFAKQIEAVLESAGWMSNTFSFMYAAMTPFRGAKVSVSKNVPEALTAAQRLISAFREVGIPTESLTSDALADGRIIVTIGSK
ncbi:MAG TPA: hypothetical protein VGR95_06165 [Thermoanaerobaculia bacterium]|nr:hypothetical protein [Thermoanaerobaculia bacterium]